MWKYLITAICAILLFMRIKNRKYVKLSKQLKTSLPSVPFFGICLMFKGSDEDRMKSINKLGEDALLHGGVSSAWMVNNLYIVLVDAEMIDLVMKTSLEKNDVLRFVKYVTGNGSIFAPVPIWRPRRKVVAPTFSQKNLNGFVQVFQKQSSIMVEILRPTAGGGPLSVWKYLTTYTLDSVCETALGVKVHSQKDPNQPFLKSFEIFCEEVARRVCQPWLHSDAVYQLLPAHRRLKKAKNYMCGFVDQIIKAKRKELREKLNQTVQLSLTSDPSKDLKSFLDLLIESSGGEQGFSDLELQEETLVMVMAGTDTSAVGAAFTALMLARHQDVQQMVHQEIKEVFGTSNKPVEPEDLPKLKYLEAAVKETLRLYPPVPLLSRKIDKEVVLRRGVTLLKGCEAIIPVWWLHRNPRYWGSDAHLFRPERFFEGPLKHASQFIPFSCGPRACLGYQYAMMSMKTVLVNLVRHYHVLPAAPTPVLQRAESDHLRVKYDIMMKHVDDFELRLEFRTEVVPNGP